MNFKQTEEEELIYQTALDFGRTMDTRLSGSFSDQSTQWIEAGKFGLLGLCIPKQYGGMGIGALSTALGLEAFSRGSKNTGFAFSIAAHLFACAKPLSDFANDDLKGKFLPQLCGGKKIGANAITEAEAGSDTSILNTTAIKSGNNYFLNGLKLYVTNAPIADCFIIYATTNRSHGYQGVSAFFVEKSAPGVLIRENVEKLGPVHSTIGEIHLTDCAVPVENRIGTEGDGAAIFKSAMIWERACLFAIYLGQMDQQIDQVVEHAVHRRQFRKAIGKNQAISHRIADMKIRLEAARWLLYHACWKFDQGVDATLEISLAKVAVSEAAIKSSLDCIQIFGGSGVLSENRIEHGLRNAIPSSIFSGTSEIQRDLIARKLGL